MKKFKTLATILTVSALVIPATFASFGSTNDGGHAGNSGFDFEIEVPDEPETEESEPEEIIINLTNTKTDETVKVHGTKTWVDKDNAYGIRPDSITVNLYADGKDTGLDAVASESTNWKYEFEEQPKYNEDGSLIEYTIKETAVAGYTVSYSKETDSSDSTDKDEDTNLTKAEAVSYDLATPSNLK